MKKFTLFTAILLMSNLLSAQWIQQNPNYPDTLNLNDVFFIDQINGWANGEGWETYPENGNYYRTHDGGANWYSWQDSIQWLLIPMNSLYFVDQNHGWGVWWGSVYKTEDGGSNWVGNYINTQYNLTSVFFLDSLNGWTIGIKPSGIGPVYYDIFYTNNGGNDWVIKDEGSAGLYAEQAEIKFFNEDLGWAAVGNRLEITTDAGNTWGVQYLDFYCHSLCIVDESVLWIAGFDLAQGNIYSSNDGGLTWSQKLGDTIPILNDIVFADSYFGWAVGDNGTILHTSDGGETWVYQESRTIADLYSISIVDENYGWICGDSSIILHTENGGTVGVGPSDQKSKFNVQCFPNPFSSFISVTFNLPEAAEVFIQIFNSTGKNVGTHHEGSLPENQVLPAGKHSIHLNTEHLPRGIYFCRLQVGSELIATKMIKN
nr:T9SS type A sorting domain-containing protein [Bacteroidota bacterium]